MESGKIRAEHGDNSTEKLKLEDKLWFLENIRIAHQDALNDEDYMHNFYDKAFQMINRGGLTLISKGYFKFGLSLMEKIRGVVSQQSIEFRRNDLYNNAYDCLIANEELKSQFRESENATSVPSFVKKRILRLKDSDKDEIYLQLITKAFRARLKVEIERHREAKLSRYAEGSSRDSHREVILHNGGKQRALRDGKIADGVIDKLKLDFEHE